MTTVCVFCGSSPGAHPAFRAAARELGAAIARSGRGLVFGGGHVGLMAELSDGFVVLPGGIGTLEEFFEVWTWGQLGLHAKPFGLLNVEGYFSPLLTFLDHAVEQRFIRREHRDLLVVDQDVDRLLARLDEHRPPVLPKWIDAATS